MSNIIKYVSQVSTPSILSAAGTAIAANTTGNRSGFMIQNLGTNPLFVRLGASASTSVFHIVLKAGEENDDGTGGIASSTDGIVWQGEISVAGTTPRFVATEYA